LAIELAAARTRLLDPDGLLRRLAESLDALGKGTVDMPTRHQTLRATVEWSVGLLNDAERSLLETAAVSSTAGPSRRAPRSPGSKKIRRST
jgi:predicted ATPase